MSSLNPAEVQRLESEIGVHDLLIKRHEDTIEDLKEASKSFQDQLDGKGSEVTADPVPEAEPEPVEEVEAEKAEEVVDEPILEEEELVAEEEEVVEEEGPEGLPGDVKDYSRDELKSVLRGADVEFSGNAKNETLVKLVEDLEA